MIRTPPRDTRHVTLARALHSRLYVNGAGRIFAVDGKIAHAKLAKVLDGQEYPPTSAAAPTPADLGIAAIDGELTQDLLHSVGRALHRWQKELNAETRRRPAHRRSSICLCQERKEIEKLILRWTEVRQWSAQLAAGVEPIGAPFFLDSIAEENLQAALRNAQCAHRFPPLIVWQARVVYWLSGECAVRRFLSATIGLLDAYPEVSRHEQVRSFQHALVVWKYRSAHEQVRHLFTEIGQYIQRLPANLVQEGGFTSRAKGRPFREHCDLLFKRCSQLLERKQLYRWHIIPAALAALAAADGSTVALPQQCFRAGAEQENFAQLARTIARLAEQIHQPGYDGLLAAIDSLPESAREIEFGTLRQLLHRGNSLADVAWANEQDLLPDTTVCCLRISDIRRLGEEFKIRGCELSSVYLRCLANTVHQPEDLPPIKAWLKWLSAVSPRTITPRVRPLVHRAFWRIYLPSVQQLGWFDQLAPILIPPQAGKECQDSAHMLERIAVYQQLTGKEQTLPKSLRKLLDRYVSRQREMKYLRARLANGTLSAAARARLDYLQKAADVTPNAGKIRRAAEELFLLLGVEALKAVASHLAEAKCRQHLGDILAYIAPDQLWKFALWINKMSEQERHRLRAVIAARIRHGREYKRYLSDNRPWISKAQARGLHLHSWFDAQPQLEILGDRSMEITLAGDLHHIFLMGAYFGTCLSLGDVNEMSVLTNAYDANKQVVFMFTPDDAGRRHVVARQLIAISSEFKLLGYNCYVNSHHADKVKRQEIVDAMASYCGRLAAKCGLELADLGTPEEIGEHFWYDDGECAWPVAAQAAWVENSCPAETVLTC